MKSNTPPLTGAHMSIAGGVDLALDRAKAAGCRTLQIFTKNNNQWRASPLTERQIRTFQEKRRTFGIDPVVAHTSYLLNIASADAALYQRSIDAFVIELERCEALEVEYLVVHPGAAGAADRHSAIRRVVRALKTLIRRTRGYRVMICLETTAGQGTSLGHRFEEIAEMIHGTASSRIGVCLDTCHIFAAGYELLTKAGYQRTIKAFDRFIGLSNLKVIHVNDSKKPFESRVDRHAHIGEGMIGLAGFHFLMRDRRLQSIPKILETPKGPDLSDDIKNLKILAKLASTPLNSIK